MSLTVGARLKAAREAKGVGMEEAVRVTKIQRRILEAIEEDKVQETLDSAYAKIFLKKYAVYLGLDGATLTEEYLASHGMPSQPPAAQSTVQGLARPTLGKAEGPAGPDLSSLRPLLIGLGAGAAALIGISFLVYLGLDLANNLKTTRRALRPQPAQTAAAEKRPDPRPLLVPVSKKLQLTVQTTADVWLQVKADGTVVFQNVLRKGSKENWTAQRELELWTGNAGAMALALNGKPLEGLGRGVKRGVKITHSGIEK